MDKTPQNASLKMRVLILDTPNSRSLKVMGTSVILKPNCQVHVFGRGSFGRLSNSVLGSCSIYRRLAGR